MIKTKQPNVIMNTAQDPSYYIEQLYIDGFSPSRIAKILECDIKLVYDWLQDNGLLTQTKATPLDKVYV